MWDPSDAEKHAIKMSWLQPHKGHAHADFRRHIEQGWRSGGGVIHDFDIVQSRWVGTSRMVDELAKECLVIPISLGCDTLQSKPLSYPPIDPNVLEYITGRALDTYEVTRRCSTFVQALLQHTLATLQNDFASTSDFLSLCRSFRDKMQEGMQWGCHGAYRAKFYQEVLCLSDHLFRRCNEDEASYLVDACNALLRLLYGTIKGERSIHQDTFSLHRPEGYKLTVIIAFDNAESLIDGATSLNSIERSGHLHCNVAAELKRAFTHLPPGLPVIALFLSHSPLLLSGTMRRLSPHYIDGQTGRISRPMPLWMELQFDLAASKISVANGFTLTQVTSDDYMCRLGRVAFASLWTSTVGEWRQRVIPLAAQQLLHTSLLERTTWNPVQLLTCVSQRLALSFDDRVGMEQLSRMRVVQDHLRLCVPTKLDSELTGVQVHTFAGSEPLLAEAAYYAMSRSGVDMPSALTATLVDLPVDMTNAVQLMMSMLLILARDAAVGEPSVYGHPVPRSCGRSGRIMDALDFFRALFTFMDDRSPTRRSHPSECDSFHERNILLEQLEEHFSGLQIYFNHFVPVPPKVLQLDYIIALLARGAAARCDKPGYPVNAVLTMVRNGQVAKGTVSLILLRAMQDEGERPDEVFSAMDPYSLNIWPADAPLNGPLVRIVFAFRCPRGTGSYYIARRSNGNLLHGTFVSYDIWITGLAPTVLRPVTPAREQDMREILALSMAHNTRSSLRHDRGQYVPTAMLSASLRIGAETWPSCWHGWTQDDWSGLSCRP